MQALCSGCLWGRRTLNLIRVRSDGATLLPGMDSLVHKYLTHAVVILVGIYFSIAGLVYAQGFLMPITIAGLLAMLLLPLCQVLEKLRVTRTLAAFVSLVLLLALALGVNFLLIKQVQIFVEDIPQMTQNLQPKIEGLKG